MHAAIRLSFVLVVPLDGQSLDNGVLLTLSDLWSVESNRAVLRLGISTLDTFPNTGFTVETLVRTERDTVHIWLVGVRRTDIAALWAVPATASIPLPERPNLTLRIGKRDRIDTYEVSIDSGRAVVSGGPGLLSRFVGRSIVRRRHGTVWIVCQGDPAVCTEKLTMVMAGKLGERWIPPDSVAPPFGDSRGVRRPAHDLYLVGVDPSTLSSLDQLMGELTSGDQVRFWSRSWNDRISVCSNGACRVVGVGGLTSP